RLSTVMAAPTLVRGLGPAVTTIDDDQAMARRVGGRRHTPARRRTPVHRRDAFRDDPEGEGKFMPEQPPTGAGDGRRAFWAISLGRDRATGRVAAALVRAASQCSCRVG